MILRSKLTPDAAATLARTVLIAHGDSDVRIVSTACRIMETPLEIFAVLDVRFTSEFNPDGETFTAWECDDEKGPAICGEY